jgi:hypothetical protein
LLLLPTLVLSQCCFTQEIIINAVAAHLSASTASFQSGLLLLLLLLLLLPT